MKIHITKPLFAWDELEDCPSLQTVRVLLELIPDGPLLAALRAIRGHGRDDYPLRVLWGTVLLQTILRHPTMEACLGELRRNAGLRRLLGLTRETEVPKPHNMSRFLERLGHADVLPLVEEAFAALVRRLGAAVPDLGRHAAGDATGLSARRHHEEQRAAEEELPQANGGRKEYRNAQGQVERVVEWYGYKLHLLVDVKHEVVLAYRVTSATTPDNQTLPEVVRRAQACLPAGRLATLACDKAADDEQLHRWLREQGIKPVIPIRALWKEETERMLPGHTGRSNIVYDELGTLHCYDKVSDPPIRHRMACQGHEAARGTLKYRCPACHQGWRCPSGERCNADRPYGLTVRVKQDIDLRRFPPIPRGTKQFERLYKGRTAVERVNGRLKVFWGADDGNVVGARRFHAQVGVVMVVHAAFATLLARLPRWEGTWSHTRLGPIQKALRGGPAP